MQVTSMTTIAPADGSLLESARCHAWPRSRLAVGILAALAVLALLGCGGSGVPKTLPQAATGPAKESAPEAASATHAPRPAVRAAHRMVVAANPLAAEAGAEILRAGGTSLDAAIAVQMVLNLVEPQSSGIGGGGFLLYFDAQDGGITAYDGRETAPAAATADMFLQPDGTPMSFYDAVVGGLSVGVPGVLRMLEAAHRDHGRLPWARLFDPAIRLAERGFAVSPRLHELIADDDHLRTSPAATAYFYGTDGAPLPVGTILKNPTLADTFRRIAKGGADVFYSGPIAADIVAAVRFAPRRPGRLALADLASYRPKRTTALCRPYHENQVCSMPPPSSGGVTTLEILGLLEGEDLAHMPPESIAGVHLIAEASRLAFADRDRYVADPDFVQVPVDALLSPSYLRQRAALISPVHSLGIAQPGRVPDQSGEATPPRQLEPVSTSHMSIVDGEGNAVSFTTTIENAFGSRLMVRGFLLNNQLTDFSFRPTVDGRPVANAVAPGKRPRSTMAPTIVLDRGRHLAMAVGSPGGSAIIGYVVKTIIGVEDWGLDIQSAVALPNFVNRNGATELESGTPIEALAPGLRALGHEVKLVPMTSGLHGIAIDPSGLTAGIDPRREGAGIGD